MTTGETLRALRERRGISISRLAGLADVSKSVVANAEGDKKATTLASVVRIVEAGLEMSMMTFWRQRSRPSPAKRVA